MPFNRIMASLDGSLLAEYILRHIEDLAQAHRSEVVLVHVITGAEDAEGELTPSALPPT